MNPNNQPQGPRFAGFTTTIHHAFQPLRSRSGLKTAVSLFAVALSLIATASADWVVETKNEEPEGATTIVSKLKGTKVRTDNPKGPAGPMSMIYDTASGDWILLMHGVKSFQKANALEMKRQTDDLWSKAPAGNGPLPKFEDTGKKEKVGDFDCEIYTVNAGKMSERLWMATNHPQAAVLKSIDKLTCVLLPPPLDYSKLPGVLVKMEILVDGKKATNTVISVKEQDVSASEFDPPAGYTALPGAGPAPSDEPKPASKITRRMAPGPGATIPGNPPTTANVPPPEGVTITLTPQNIGKRYGAGFPATQMPANRENYFWVVDRPDNQTKVNPLHNNQWHFANQPGHYKIQIQYRSGDITKTVSNVLEVTIP